MNTIKINVTRIMKEHLYQGKNGKYLDMILWENKTGPDQYGNTHTVVQSVSKEARERGIKGPIIGNAKLDLVARPAQPPARPAQTSRHAPPRQSAPREDDEVPF